MNVTPSGSRFCRMTCRYVTGRHFFLLKLPLERHRVVVQYTCILLFQLIIQNCLRQRHYRFVGTLDSPYIFFVNDASTPTSFMHGQEVQKKTSLPHCNPRALDSRQNVGTLHSSCWYTCTRGFAIATTLHPLSKH